MRLKGFYALKDYMTLWTEVSQVNSPSGHVSPPLAWCKRRYNFTRPHDGGVM